MRKDTVLPESPITTSYGPMYTAPAIEDLILATLGDKATIRERHVLRQSLLNLVRLARAEQCAEMQASVDKAVYGMPSESVLLA